MAETEKVIIEIQLDDGSVKKGFLTIEKQAEASGQNIAKSLQGGLGGLSAGKIAAGLAGLFGIFKGISGAVNLLGDAIRDASAEADAINRLNTALASTGKFSQESSKALQDFAEGIEKSSRFSSETTLEITALIQQLGNLDQQGLQKATKAALDLSSALGIDVNSAAQLVSKAATGNVQAFNRLGLEIQKGKTDAETFANTLRVLESRFGGATEATARTFSGALNQVQNAFGDIGKEIGKVITQSPALIAVFNVIGEVVSELKGELEGAVGGADLFKPLISGAATFAALLTSFVGPAIEFTFQGVRVLTGTLLSGFLAVNTAIAGVFALYEQALNKVLGTKASALTDTFTASMEKLKSTTMSTEQAFTSLGQTGGTDAVLDVLARIKGAVDSTSGSLTQMGDNVRNNANPAIEELRSKFQLGVADIQANASTLGQQFGLVTQGMQDSINSLVEQGSAGFKEIGKAAFQTLGQGVGQAFAAFGRALARGENALAAFTKAFLQSIGQGAIALGTEFILRGIAYSFVPGLQSFGPPLIAAGAALATFGGVLGGALAGDTATVGSTAGGGGFSPVEQPGEALPTLEPAQQGTQVSINIEGNVLDRRDTGLAIAEVLQEFFDTNNGVLVRT